MAGQLTSVGNSVSTTSFSQYDALGRPKQGAQTPAGGSPYPFTATWDRMGHLKTLGYPSGRTITYDYDAAGRPLQAVGTKSGETAKTYASQATYAAHGGPALLSLGNGLWDSRHYNVRLQNSTIALGNVADGSSVWGISLDYRGADNNGNLRSDTVNIPGKTWTHNYSYDAFGQLAAEYEIGTPPLNRPGPLCTTCYLFTDHLGSTRGVWDGGGLRARYDYLPFGESLPSDRNNRGSLACAGGTTGCYGATGSLAVKFTGKERGTIPYDSSTTQGRLRLNTCVGSPCGWLGNRSVPSYKEPDKEPAIGVQRSSKF